MQINIKKTARFGAVCEFHDRTDDCGFYYAANFSS